MIKLFFFFHTFYCLTIPGLYFKALEQLALNGTDLLNWYFLFICHNDAPLEFVDLLDETRYVNFSR